VIGFTKKLWLSEVQGDARKFAAAQHIDATYGIKDNGVVTKRDLRLARKAYAQHQRLVSQGKAAYSPLAGVRPDVIDLYKEIPSLEPLLHGRRAQVHKDFFTSMPCNLIAVDGVRHCAKAIAENVGGRIGKEDNELNLDELQVAERVLKGEDVSNGDPAVKACIDALKKDASFTVANVKRLSMFMRDGLGDILRYGTMRVNGREFTDVFRVPRRATKNGESTAASAYDDAIQSLEALLGRVSYDRLYIKMEDGELYVALNHRRVYGCDGSLNDIQEGYKVQVPGADGKYRDAGMIIYKEDINNSVHEAVTQYFGDRLAALVKYIREKTKSGEARVTRDLGDGVVERINRPQAEGPASQIGWREALIGVGTVIASGVAVVSTPAAVATFFTTLGTVSVGNLYEVAHGVNDLRPLYHGLGIAVNAAHKVRT
jgi:hypothetical protein